MTPHCVNDESLRPCIYYYENLLCVDYKNIIKRYIFIQDSSMTLKGVGSSLDIFSVRP